MSNPKQEKFSHTIEIIVVILMGLTALLTAWASWVGSLHSGNQATNYTVSNNIASEGNSEYNAASQYLMQDMILWNEIADMQFDIWYAYENDDEYTLALQSEKLYFKLYENLSDDMAAAIAWDFPESDDYVTTILDWMENEEAVNTPFADEEYFDSYYEYAYELLAESDAVLEQGKEDNANGDKFGLITVIFSVSLFLLGMISTMESVKNKYILLGVAGVSIVFATIFMLCIPLPTGFSLANFF
ncbi:MAG: hypothetical protein R3Y06_08865 [Faecalibacterium sp.]